MRHSVHRPLWRQSFVWALHQLGEAAARLPFGVPEPILCDVPAVELYTGGLWVAPRLVVQSQAACMLTPERFAAGFRVQQHQHGVGRMDLVAHRVKAGSTETTNAIRVTVDELTESDHAEPVSIKVIALEDLIVEEVIECLTYDRLSTATVERIRVLVELGRAGVGGGFRPSYLERRLACETEGQVVFDWPSLGGAHEYPAAGRTITLGQMRHLISRWRAERGFPFADAALPPRWWVENPRPLGYRAGAARRSGRSSGQASNVIPFNTGAATLHFQD
jgi:hypothetical protein